MTKDPTRSTLGEVGGFPSSVAILAQVLSPSDLGGSFGGGPFVATLAQILFVLEHLYLGQTISIYFVQFKSHCFYPVSAIFDISNSHCGIEEDVQQEHAQHSCDTV